VIKAILGLRTSRWYVHPPKFVHLEHVVILYQCPIHKKLVDVNLLSIKERDWLNRYHKQVLELVGPLLKNDLRALEWLQRECSPL
jgi:Xaa-Pro aminopeptidase